MSTGNDLEHKNCKAYEHINDNLWIKKRENLHLWNYVQSGCLKDTYDKSI